MKDGQLDLDLLRFFAALKQTGALHRAAAQLEWSQPAASRALQRLRGLFDDKLFVKSGMGMAPTPRALSLWPGLQDALARMEALVVPEVFDPSQSRRNFRIALMDNAVAVVLRPVLAEFLRRAPKATLEILPLEADVAEQLREGRTDLVVYVRPYLPPDCHSRELLASDYVCLVRRGHPLLKETVPGRAPSLAAFRRYPRISVKARWGTNVRTIDQSAMPGLEDRPATVLAPYFLAAPLLLQDTDLVLVLPRPTAQGFADKLPLELLPTPQASGVYRPELAWHDRVHKDPAIRWLRELICEVMDQRRAAAAAAAAPRKRAAR